MEIRLSVTGAFVEASLVFNTNDIELAPLTAE